MSLLPLTLIAAQFDFVPPGRPLAFLDFRAETFAPVTREGITKYTGRIDSREWHRFLGVIYRHTKIGGRAPVQIDARRVRLRIDDGRRVWFVDATGRFAGTGRFGTIPRKELSRWNARLLQKFHLELP